MNKRNIIKAGIVIIGILTVLNIGWFVAREIKYRPYKQDLSKSIMSTSIVPRYTMQDEDGFTYALKYPDYMSLSSNLSVSLPVEDDNPYVDSLIIWIDTFHEKEYGVVLYEKENTFQIEIDNSGNPLDAKDQDVINRHKENLDHLLKKAKEKWRL